MPPVIFLHSQFLCVWQFATGASTAGFLEKAAADLERELRTFKYPAMFLSPNDSAVDTRRNSEQRGGQALLGLLQYTEQQQHRPPFPSRRDKLSYVRVNEPEEGLKQQRLNTRQGTEYSEVSFVGFSAMYSLKKHGIGFKFDL